MPIRTALYLRISHPDAVRRGSSSIPAQFARLREEAERAGEIVVETFADEAKSGTKAAGRTEYQRLLSWVRSGRVDKVRIEDVDRGHRNELDRRTFEAELGRYGVRIQYSGEPEQLSPALRSFQRSIKGALAEMESHTTAGRVYKRQRYLVQRGKWLGGRAPYGLRPDGQGWLEADPETYPVLLWILEQRAAGRGYGAICGELNAGFELEGRQVRPLPPNTRRWQAKPTTQWQNPETGELEERDVAPPSGLWPLMSVRNICRNEIYAGVLVWGREAPRHREDADGRPKEVQRVETGRWLVPEELWRRVAAAEGRLAGRRWRSTGYVYLLRPTCGSCGGRLLGTKSGSRYAYRCIGRTTFSGTCLMRDVRADHLEELVLGRLSEAYRVSSPAELTEQVHQEAERRRRELEDGVSRLSRALRAAETRREQALRSLDAVAGRLSDRLLQVYLERAEEATREVDQLQADLRTVEAGLISLRDRQQELEALALQRVQGLFTALERSQREELRLLLLTLVREVVVYPAPPGTGRPDRVDVVLATPGDLLSE